MGATLNPAAEFDYNLCVCELFASLQHAGMLEVAPDVLSAVAGAREQGARVQLFIEVRDAHAQTVRYQAYGCPYFLAACESLARWLEGRACTELSQWRWRDVEVELQAPVAKRARLLLLDDAMRDLQRRLGASPSVWNAG